MFKFDKKIFMLGCGGVAQCTLPILMELIDIDPKNVTIMDFVDNRIRIKKFLDRGITYVQNQITEENYAAILKKYLSPGDLFIDLAWNIETCAMLDWCQENGVIYINTSVEEWVPYENIENLPFCELTLYQRQMEIRELTNGWKKDKKTTAVVDHGANPGLVSHFTKQALWEIANKIIQEKPNDSRRGEIEKFLAEKNFAQLARLTETKVIHISERDTQITSKPKEVNEFVNTWSIEGFMEEGMAPAELGWGTHEKTLPKGAHLHKEGPKNQIFLPARGMDTWVHSWVPAGPIIGMVIRHGEAFGISDRLTVWEGDKAIYRPTVHYAYCPTDSAIASLHELKMRNFVSQEKRRILNDDIISGEDQVGCLLMGHDFNAWWIGSCLDIAEARRLAPGQNATTLQVAISIVATAIYAIKNPNLGFCLPDDLDHDVILKIAKPYLGKFVSEQVDWTPISGPNVYLVFGKDVPSREDMWQFSTFHVRYDFYNHM